MQTAKGRLAETLGCFNTRIQETTNLAVEDLSQAPSFLEELHKMFYAVFTVQAIPAMRGPICTAEDSSSLFPQVQKMMDREQQLFNDTAEALLNRTSELEELLSSDSSSISEMYAIKIVLMQRHQAFDKFLGVAGQPAVFGNLRGMCIQRYGVLKLQAAKQTNGAVNDGLSALSDVAANGKIQRKTATQVRNMVKAFNTVDLVQYEEQEGLLAEVVQELCDKMGENWDGHEPVALSDVICLQSTLNTIGILAKTKSGLSCAIKDHLNENHALNIDTIYGSLIENLEAFTLPWWIETVEKLIQDKEFADVDYQLSPVKKIITATGTGVSKRFQQLVKEMLHSPTPGNSGTPLRGPRKYIGKIGTFGPMLLDQLEGLLDELRGPLMSEVKTLSK